MKKIRWFAYGLLVGTAVTIYRVRRALIAYGLEHDNVGH